MHPEFVVDVRYVGLGRVHGDDQLLLDVLGVTTLGYKEEYLGLAR